MRARILVMMTAVAVLLNSCGINIGNQLLPSKERVKKAYKLDNFDQIETMTAINVVYLKSDTAKSVVLDVPKNMEEYVSVKVKNNKLKVNFDGLHNINGNHKTTLYVSGYKVNKFETSSAGNIYIKGAINYDGEVAMVTSSAGNVHVEAPVKAESLFLSASSAGYVKVKSPVTVMVLYVNASSAGDIKVHDVTAFDVAAQASSAGDIKISGTCRILKTDKSSAGDIDTKDLIVRE